MKLNFTTAFLAAAVTGSAIQAVHAAHIMACTQSLDGKGPYAVSITEDCCEKQPLSALPSIDKVHNHCSSGTAGGNGLNQGDFTKCCAENNTGTHAT